jgi:hypothetical protein
MNKYYIGEKERNIIHIRKRRLSGLVTSGVGMAL